MNSNNQNKIIIVYLLFLCCCFCLSIFICLSSLSSSILVTNNYGNHLNPTISYDNYDFYQGVIGFGNHLSDYQYSASIDNGKGCLSSLNISDAKNLCQQAHDCNAFFAFDNENLNRVCFMNNVDPSKTVIIHNDGVYPNSGIYIQK